MHILRVIIVTTTIMFSLATAYAQDQGKWNFNVGGGIGFPQGDLSSFVNNGGHFVIGGGYNFVHHLSVNSEFMWQDLPINSATKAQLQTTGASARQYSWTFNPIFYFPIANKVGGYAIGGIGWYHRSGETTTPGVGIVCDPYWSWWYGCSIGSVNFVTGSKSANAFGENIGGGLAYRLGESGIKLYAEVRYHHAPYNKVSTAILPLTFGIRW